MPFPEGVSPDQTPNWPEILKEDKGSGIYGYVVPRQPLAISNMVSAGIFQILTSKDIQAYELESFRNGPFPDVSKTADVIEDLTDDMMSTNYYEERAYEEAKKLGEDAANSDNPFWYKSYDTWYAGNFPARINQQISFSPISNYPDFLLARLPQPRIGGNFGFPVVLSVKQIEMNQRYMKKGPGTPFTTLNRVLLNLDQNPDQVIQDILNMKIVTQFKRIGYLRIDEVLNSQGLPTERSNFDEFHRREVELMRLIYPELTKEEQELIRRPWREHVGSFDIIKIPLSAGSQQGTFDINISLGMLFLKYNPETQDMNASVLNAESKTSEMKIPPNIFPTTRHTGLLNLPEINITGTTIPVLTPETTHEQLLVLRDQGKKLSEKMNK